MIISEIILSLIRSFREPLIRGAQFGAEELSEVFDNKLPKYLETIKGKFEKTKTFLFRDTQVPFDKTYYPVAIQKRQVISFGNPDSKATEGVFEYVSESIAYRFTSVESLYKNNNYTTIIGQAGSGKSMLMKKIFLTCLHQRIKIPVFIELRNLNNYEEDFAQFISEKIFNLGVSNNNRIINRMLNNGSFLFLLDGYDEIYSSNKIKITEGIENFVDSNSKNWFVITSRNGSGIESFPRFDNNYILPLDKTEIEEFIKLQCKLIKDEELGLKIISEIEESENKSINAYLRNPLLLSMFLFSYRSNINIPDSKSDFYQNVFNTILTKHYAFTRTGGWQHERLSNLSNRQITEVLYWLSYRTFFQGLIEFKEIKLQNELDIIINKLELTCDSQALSKDLLVHINILIKDGRFCKFPHRSLQEYFTVCLISKLPEITKERIYSEQLVNYFNNSTDAGFNILDLFLEKDKYSFYKFFAIPQLSRLKDLLESSEQKIWTRKLIRFLNLNVRIRIDYELRDIRVMERKVDNIIIDTSFEYITGHDFTKLSIDEILRPFYSPKTCKLLVENCFKPSNTDKSKTFDIKDLNSEQLIDLYETIEKFHEFDKELDVYNQIQKSINKIEEDLNDDNLNQLNLLEI